MLARAYALERKAVSDMIYRRKLLPIAESHLFTMLRSYGVPIPNDAALIHVEKDRHGCTWLAIQSEEFEEVADGSRIPALEYTVTREANTV